MVFVPLANKDWGFLAKIIKDDLESCSIVSMAATSVAKAF